MDALFNALGFYRVDEAEDKLVYERENMNKKPIVAPPVGPFVRRDPSVPRKSTDPIDFPFNQWTNYCGKCERQLSDQDGCEECKNNGITILITGAGGYIASSLIDMLLNKGFTVVGIDNNFKNTCDSLIPYVPNSRFKFELGDVTDVAFVKYIFSTYRISYILHAAALVGFPICDKYKSLSFDVNVRGTENIVTYQPEDVRLLFCSTGSVYSPGQTICNEKSDVNPPSHYGRTKMYAEDVVLSNPNNLVHRYATAIGISKHNMRVNLLANDLTHQAVVNKTFTVFENSFYRTFIHVNDIASAIVFSIENYDELLKDKNRIFNVGNADLNMTKRELCEIIVAKTGAYVHYAEFNKDKDIRDYRYDVSKFYGYGWRPKYGMEETIDELIKVAPMLSKLDKYQ